MVRFKPLGSSGNRGDIHSPWAQRAKEYSWNACLEFAPRSITPTDYDFVVECNSHFQYFEFKENGSEMSTGQRICFERQLKIMPNGKAFLIVASHPRLEVVAIPVDLTSFQFCWYGHRKKLFGVTPKLAGDLFKDIYKAFFEYAEGDRKPLGDLVRRAGQFIWRKTLPGY